MKKGTTTATKKTETVSARIESQLKRDVESVLEEIGLSVSDAIVLFLKQVKLNRGIPFEIKIPRKGTRKTVIRVDDEYDFSKAKKNPYISRMKKTKNVK